MVHEHCAVSHISLVAFERITIIILIMRFSLNSFLSFTILLLANTNGNALSIDDVVEGQLRQLIEIQQQINEQQTQVIASLDERVDVLEIALEVLGAASQAQILADKQQAQRVSTLVDALETALQELAILRNDRGRFRKGGKKGNKKGTPTVAPTSDDTGTSVDNECGGLFNPDCTPTVAPASNGTGEPSSDDDECGGLFNPDCTPTVVPASNDPSSDSDECGGLFNPDCTPTVAPSSNDTPGPSGAPSAAWGP
jgi:hypothetical protein